VVRLPIRSWICQAAAVFGDDYGAVAAQARQEECSRQAIYERARKLEKRLQEHDAERTRLQGEVKRLQAELKAAQERLTQATPIGDEALSRFAITSQAIGVSLRQTEELLGTLLPKERVPDHATIGRWTQEAGQRAAAALAALDPLCVPAVRTLCVDEIFFGG
jgi:predicted DNA-binding protein YlxM (UPF0122 family)